MVSQPTKKQKMLFQELDALLNYSPHSKRIVLTAEQYALFQKAMGGPFDYRGAKIVCMGNHGN